MKWVGAMSFSSNLRPGTLRREFQACEGCSQSLALLGKAQISSPLITKTPFLRMAGIPDLDLLEYPGILQHCLVVIGLILPCRVDDYCYRQFLFVNVNI